MIVKDGLVHSEGLSVYPLGCWVDCWWHHKSWHGMFDSGPRSPFSPLISLYSFFSKPFLLSVEALFPFQGWWKSLVVLQILIFDLIGHNLTGSLVHLSWNHRMRASEMEETRRACR